MVAALTADNSWTYKFPLSTCHGVTQSVGGLESTRPESEAGCAALVLERARLCGFAFGARPAVRLRSGSEAGWAASVLERGRLCGFGREARPAGRLRFWSEAGCAASVGKRGWLGSFGFGARPAVRLRSGSEAGRAASVGKLSPEVRSRYRISDT